MKKEPWEMTRREFSIELETLNRCTTLPTKKEHPWSLNEESLYKTADWKAFSRSRGYSEKEIREYARWMKLIKLEWDKELKVFCIKWLKDDRLLDHHDEHVRRALSEGKPVSKEVKEEWKRRRKSESHPRQDERLPHLH